MGTRETILRSVVIHYINEPTPIGSVQLKEDLRLDISSATIRNHFKRLVDEGLLAQLHTSSGRVPTERALRRHWSETLERGVIPIASRQTLKEAAYRYGIFVRALPEVSNRITEVINVGQRYLVVALDAGEIVLPYSKPMERFLSEFSGYEYQALYKVAKQMGALDLAARLRALPGGPALTANRRELIAIAYHQPQWADTHFQEVLDGGLAAGKEEGIFFDPEAPQGCMMTKHRSRLEGEEASLFCIGSLSRNFGAFFKSLQGGGQ